LILWEPGEGTSREIETFMGFARYKLQKLDAGLLDTLLRLFPSIRP
jgi:hypothetical protein